MQTDGKFKNIMLLVPSIVGREAYKYLHWFSPHFFQKRTFGVKCHNSKTCYSYLQSFSIWNTWSKKMEAATSEPKFKR